MADEKQSWLGELISTLGKLFAGFVFWFSGRQSKENEVLRKDLENEKRIAEEAAEFARRASDADERERVRDKFIDKN